MDNKLKLKYEHEIKRPFTDNLTGLFNHGFFQMLLELEIQRTQRYHIPFTLGLFDIDSFSFYNNRHGALQGDRMLQEIAGIIKANIRQTDIAARYSNDVFVVILAHSGADIASIVAERIRYSVDQSADIPLTISIGLASFPRDATNTRTLIHKAQMALEQAKIRGENKVYFFKKEKRSLNKSPSRIMIVDDDPRNLKLLEALLIPLNFTAIKVDNGEECLHLLNKVEVDLVLLDVMMPGMDGFEVCRRVKEDEATRMIPVILLTALDDMQSKVKGIEAGADDFITKPPNKMELLARTRSLIKLKKLNSNLTSIENVLFSLANSVEAKDVYTQGHIDRVSTMAVALGKKMGLSVEEIEALRFGGALHDIGKLGVPGKILNKPGPLDSEEWDLMKRHSEIGYKICLPLQKILGQALEVIRHHHEKLDGSGYPDRLKDDEISMVARIMAVADIYDALITDRPYRKGIPKKKVLEILRQEVLEGKLDQEVVENLIEMTIQEEEEHDS